MQGRTAPMLPSQPQASLRRGIWFVFPLPEGTVHAWGSCLSGLERVYVDGQLVSERRSARRASSHAFDVRGRPHTLVFRSSDLLKGRLECSVAAEGKWLAGAAARFAGRRRASVLRLALCVVGGIGAGVLLSNLELPAWTPWAGVAMLVLMAIAGAKATRFEFESLAPAAAGSPGAE